MHTAIGTVTERRGSSAGKETAERGEKDDDHVLNYG